MGEGKREEKTGAVAQPAKDHQPKHGAAGTDLSKVAHLPRKSRLRIRRGL